jgi:hypothetical protein
MGERFMFVKKLGAFVLSCGLVLGGFDLLQVSGASSLSAAQGTELANGGKGAKGKGKKGKKGKRKKGKKGKGKSKSAAEPTAAVIG